MELKEYTKIVQKNLWFFAILIVLGAATGYMFSKNLPTGYSQTQLFYLSTPQASPTTDTSKYYTQETARNFTDTAIAILESPDFKREASLSPSVNISARKLAPQAIDLTVSSPDSDQAKAGLTAASSAFNLQMAQVSTPLELKAMSATPQGSQIIYSKKILVTAGAVIGAIAALLITAAKIYFKV